MTTMGQMYRALNTKLTHYTAKREAAKLPETPALGTSKEPMNEITTYVSITVVLEALLVMSPCNKKQAIADLEEYKK